VALMLKGRNAAASLYVNPVISGCIPGRRCSELAL
jgi:hypothetical protein